MPGARLLGLVQLMLQTGMAMARGINRIVRQRPSFVPRSGSRSGTRSPKGQGAPRGRGAGSYLPETVPEHVAGDWHDWLELAKPWRMGPSGVAVATRMIAGLSNAEVVAGICAKLSQAAAQLGADADVGRIAEMEAAARALCPDVDAPPEETEESEGASGGWEARPPSHGAATAADREPPPKPPD
jgi:hypothetical protein